MTERPYGNSARDPATSVTGSEWKARIRGWGEDLGFSKVGFARAQDLVPEGVRLLEWLRRGYQAGMGWMAREPERRYTIERILPEARTVIACALQYKPASTANPTTVTQARNVDRTRPLISTYAQGEDYHDVLGAKLHRLRDRIAAERPALRSRIACDTSPILDKPFAAAAGLGWIGKNTCLIDRDLGSWFFIGEIFVDFEIPPDETVADHCGTCTRCLEVCPTDAFPEPYVLDATRCIAYRNIEHRGSFPDGWSESIGEWLVGCDLCQDVCPWNRKSPETSEDAFRPISEIVDVTLGEWAEMEDAEIRRRIKRSAVSRIKPADLRRNARAVQENLRQANPTGGPSDATSDEPGLP